mmetsp:Transcript_8402/g.18172  ORF Transcript_8402/g.18172 Transcript_8402/m.18172 type:complete len:502 (-) Transcript_8402:108-1613(-)
MTLSIEQCRRYSAFAFFLAAVMGGSLRMLTSTIYNSHKQSTSPIISLRRLGGNHSNRRQLSGDFLESFHDPKSTALRTHDYVPAIHPNRNNENARTNHPSTYFMMEGDHADRAPRFENEMGPHREPPSNRELPAMAPPPEGCKQSRAWHSFNPLNCNNFHELDMGMNRKEEYTDRMYYLAQGGRRDTWGLDLTVPDERAIIKTLRGDKPYSEEFFDNQRIDALALERLKDSPHIVDVYGFCGMATINEFAGNGNLYKYIVEDSNNGGAKSITSNDLLMYARNISIGLADIHEIDIDHPDAHAISSMPPTTPTLLHNDFRHHNMLMTDDYQVKVSDFNIAELLRWDADKNETCGYWWYTVCGRIIWGADRAPEECVDEHTIPLSDRTEVFHLGNVLNFILTKTKYPFVAREDRPEFLLVNDDTRYDMAGAAEKVREYILRGDLPPLPSEVAESDDPAIKALIEARDEALTFDATKRPSARDIANILDKAVSKLPGLVGSSDQ